MKITELTFGTALTIGTESESAEFASPLIDTAWDVGIRAFDTSNNYGMGKAEWLLGSALSKYPRQEYVLSTKGSWPIGDGAYHKGLSRKHILWAFGESIKRLGIDYIDIYYAHRPDSETPMAEIVRTFQYLINSGQILYWGTSEWNSEQLAECHETCDRLNCERPIVEQFFYSYAVRKAESNGVKAFCDGHGVGTLAFGSLLQGLLTGKYADGVPDDSRIAKSSLIQYDKTTAIYEQNRSTVDYFIKVCEEFRTDCSAAALQWCLRKGIYPVIGASKPKQIISNYEALSTVIPGELWIKLEGGAL
jgi:aryl-alcohol dehydrogenase-like predicted oxidoreductase